MMFKWIGAEYRLNGLDEDLGEGLWSALGDCYFPSSTQNLNLNVNKKIYHAPLVGNKIPVDYRSPYARSELPGFRKTSNRYSNSETDRIISKLNQALTRISQSDPRVIDMIDQYTKVITIKKDPRDVYSWGSSSSNAYIGSIVLENPHLDVFTSDEIVEAIIHESIHSFMYILELDNPIFSDRRLYAHEVRSPWTGNRLPLYSYLHACFVWFGLWHFWNLAIKTNLFHFEISSKHKCKSAVGFKGDSLLNPIREISTGISLARQQAIQKMQEIILTSDNFG
jgi:hypothetical protein